jgi:hypothetical protein
MADPRDIEILEYNITYLQTKIANFRQYNISEIKIQKLQTQLFSYQTELIKLQN